MKDKIITWGLGGLLTVLIGLNVWWFLTRGQSHHALLDKPAPEIQLPVLDTAQGRGAGAFRLSEHRGKVVLLDFWAVYCGPCKRQMPILEQVKSKLDGEAFEIVSVNTDDPREDDRSQRVASYVQQGGYSFTVVLDSGVAGYNFSVERIPTLVLVDKEGVVRYVHTGLSSQDALEAEIRKLLDAPTPRGA